MKTTIKRNWLVIAMTVLAFCCAIIGITTFKTDKFNNGEETKVYALSTAVDPTANGTELEAKDYYTFGTDEEFMMLPGASMRVRINDPGLRFTFQIGYDFIDKLEKAFLPSDYTAENYVKFSRDGLNGKGLPYSDIWVKANPKYKDAFKMEANVALTFTGEGGKALTPTQFELARNFEVTATAYYILTGIQGTAGEGQVYYIKAASNDNTRSMKSVVNAAILAGEEEFYPDLNAMGFVKKDDTHTVTDLTEQVLVDQSALTGNKFTFELPEFSGEIDCAYIGAKKLPATYSEGKVTVDFGSTLNYTGVQLEKVKTLSVYNVNGDIWNVPCKYVSKVITKISDLKLFEISTETTLIDGYYILGNDLTPDSLVMVHSGLTDAFRVTYENDYYKAGFCGIFDGEGHVIDGLNLTSCSGIFCHVQNNAQIRNVAFTRVTLNYSKPGSYSGDYIGNMLLAAFTSCRNYANEYVTFSNIYAQINSFGSTGSTYRSAMVRIADRMKFNSVLVECNASVAYQYNQWGRGVMAANIFEPSSTNGLVVISNNPIASQNYNSGASTQMTAPENFGLEVGGVCNKFEQPLKVRNVISGTYQWLTYNEMKNDSSSYKTTALSQFSSDVWNTKYGVPLWKSLVGSDAYVKINGEETTNVTIVNSNDGNTEQPELAEISVASPFIGKINTFEIVLKDGENLIQLDSANVIRAVTNAIGSTTATVRITVDGNVIEREITVNVVAPIIKGELRYSTLDNKLYFAGNDDYTISDVTDVMIQGASIFNGGEIDRTKVTQNVDSSDLSLNTVSAFVEINGNYKTVNLVSYTMVITKTADLHVFDLTTEQMIVKGSYILNNNIDNAGDFEPDHSAIAGNTAWNNTTVGFAGTFDGNGHYIEGLNIIGQSGIFGQLQDCAVMKNFAFTNLTLTYKNQSLDGENKCAPMLFLASKNNARNNYVSDVYLGVSNLVNVTSSTYGAVVTSNANSWVHFDSVVVEYSVEQTLPKDYPDANCWGKGSIAFAIGQTAQLRETDDVMVISNYPISMAWYAGNTSVTNRALWGQNYQGNTEFGELTPSVGAEPAYRTNAIGKKTYFLKGYLTYKTRAEAIADKANNAEFLAKFNSDLWNVSTGIPVMNSVAVNDAQMSVNGETVNSVVLTSKKDADLSENEINKAVLSISLYGEELPFSLTIPNGCDFVSYDSATRTISTIEGKTGVTTVTVTYTANGKEYTKTVGISVYASELPVELRYSSLDNKVYFANDLLDISLVSSLILEDGKEKLVSGQFTDIPSNYTTDLTRNKHDAIISYNGTLYKAKLVSYAKVITKVTDLTCLDLLTSTTVLDGYYIVNKDIDDSTQVALHHLGVTNNVGLTTSTTYFAGIFDGDGHTINNLNLVGNIGLFGQIGANAVIKNLAIMNATISLPSPLEHGLWGSSSTTCLLFNTTATSNSTAKVEDCFFNVKKVSYGTWWAVLCSTNVANNKATFKNVVLDLDQSIGNCYGVGVAGRVKGNGKFDNLLYITDAKSFISVDNRDTAKWVEGAENDTVAAIQAIGADYSGISDITLVKGTLRYLDYSNYASAVAQGDALAVDSLAKFSASDMWNTKSGYPVFGRNDVKVFANGDETEDLVIYSGEGIAESLKRVEITAKLGDTLLSNVKLTAISGADKVKISSNVVSAVFGNIGAVSLVLTGEANGVTYAKIVNADIVNILAGELRYSSLDGKFFVAGSSEDITAKITSLKVNGSETFVGGVYAGGGNNSAKVTAVDAKVTIDGILYNAKFAKYAKVLTTEQDFTCFDLSAYTDGDQTLTDAEKNAASLIGYYIVNNDINATTKVELHHTAVRVGASSWNHVGQYFAGTFDGDGHVISNFTLVGNAGIFGRVKINATLKNFAFVDASIEVPKVAEHTQGSDSTHAVTFLYLAATNYFGGANTMIVQDAYIGIKAIPNRSYLTVITASQETNYTQFKNVVVNVTPSFGSESWGKGVFGRPTVKNMQFDNVVLISDKWTEICTSNGSKDISYAENEVLEDLQAYNATFASGTCVQIKGVFHYLSADAYATEAGTADSFAAKSLAKFAASGMWDTTGDYPVFIGMAK